MTQMNHISRGTYWANILVTLVVGALIGWIAAHKGASLADLNSLSLTEAQMYCENIPR